MNENSENVEWKHVYTIKEMTPIQGLEKGLTNFTPRPVGGRGSDFNDPKLVNPKKYSLRYNPPKDWQGIKYNNHWFGLVHLLEQTHHHFNIQDFFQKGAGPYEYQRKLPRRRRALEIGSYMGESARMMMASGIFDELHIIDPWIGDEEANTAFDETWDSVKHKCKQNISQFGDKIFIYEGFSHEVYGQFIDNSFDFVYIDAAHDYESVKKDIILYNRKLKHGGIMAGNDYYNTSGHHKGVGKAVDEIWGKKNVERFIDSSWWTVKPRLKHTTPK